MSLCLIPARGGSKRIPRKNVRLFNGKPMIAWSIKVAQDTGVFDRVIVSTDDQEIAQTAADYGAEVPFTRPANYSDDDATTIDVVRHAVRWLDANGGALRDTRRHPCRSGPTGRSAIRGPRHDIRVSDPARRPHHAGRSAGYVRPRPVQHTLPGPARGMA